MEYFATLVFQLLVIITNCRGHAKGLPNISIRNGQAFEVKLNLTNKPEDLAFATFDSMKNQLYIRDVLLQYMGYDEGSVVITDSRVSLVGNAGEGEAWFLFKNVSTTDSGIYGVLYRMMDSSDVHNKTFTLNVTQRQVTKTETTVIPTIYILEWPEFPTQEAVPIKIARQRSKGTIITTAFKLLLIFTITINHILL